MTEGLVLNKYRQFKQCFPMMQTGRETMDKRTWTHSEISHIRSIILISKSRLYVNDFEEEARPQLENFSNVT